MDDKLFDEYADDYNSILSSTTKWASQDISYFADYKVLRVKKYLDSTPKQILDYGCGIGRNISFLKRHFPAASCYGCDISASSLEVSRRENPDATFFINGKGVNKGRFDLVLVTNVFHHIPPEERDQAVCELREFLSPGGSLFVFEHNPLNPLTRRVVRNIPFDKDAVCLMPRELKNRLARQGFRIDRRQYTLFYPEWASFLRWSEFYLGWLPLGAQYFIQASAVG